MADRIKPHHRSRMGATALQAAVSMTADVDLEATSWQVEAACVDTDSEAFFSDEPAEQAIAKRICAGCPVREQCLQFAHDTREQYGVWGGVTASRRRRNRTAANAAARAS